MFFVGEIVKPSCRGRTASWEGMVGTVTRVKGTSVFVQWHNVAVEEELDFEEVVSTGTCQKSVRHHTRLLAGSDEGTLVTLYDDGQKPSVDRTDRCAPRLRF